MVESGFICGVNIKDIFMDDYAIGIIVGNKDYSKCVNDDGVTPKFKNIENVKQDMKLCLTWFEDLGIKEKHTFEDSDIDTVQFFLLNYLSPLLNTRAL